MKNDCCDLECSIFENENENEIGDINSVCMIRLGKGRRTRNF